MISSSTKIWILVFAFTVFPSGYGWTQEDIPLAEVTLPEEEAGVASPEEEGASEFQDIREQIQTLLEENKALEKEHETLRSEFWELQKNVAKQKAEIVELETAAKNTVVPDIPSSNEVPLEEGGDLKQMQLDNLRYQKKERELELQSKKILTQALQKQHDEEILRLNQEDAAALDRKKELNRRLQEIGGEASGYPQEIDRVTRENDYLSGEIAEIERLLRSRKKEKKSLLKDDYGFPPTRLLKETITEKEKEKKVLQMHIEDLEAQKTVLGKKGLLGDGGDLGRLRETARQIEQENQRLRNEIFSIRQKKTGSRPSGL